MAAIIRDDPEPLPSHLPAPFRWTVERCLAKEADQRYDSTRDLYRELRQIRDGFAQVTTATPGVAPVETTRRSGLWPAISVGLVILGFAAGFLWRGSPASPALTGTRLGGPVVATSPRISPDSQLLAFIALADRQNQVAVMKPDASSWTVLTGNRTNGAVCNVAWARDGSRIFFDRFWERPSGVYSIPPLGGEPTLLLEDAWVPLPLPDGSLIVLKRTDRESDQAYRFWPDSGRSEPLPVYLEPSDTSPPIRAFPDGGEIVFIGETDGGAVERKPLPYVYNFKTRTARRLDPGMPITGAVLQLGIALAPTSDGNAVLMLQDTFELIRVGRDGARGNRSVLSFPGGVFPWYVDAAADGSLYLDSPSTAQSTVRFTLSGKLIAEAASPPANNSVAVALRDGRILIASPLAGRMRLQGGTMGADFRPSLPADTEDNLDCFVPFGDGQVAIAVGPAGNRRVSIASLRTGAVIRSVAVPGGNLKTLAIMPDGRTLFYAAGGSIFSLPVDGGAVTRIGAGSYIALDPSGRWIYTIGPHELIRIPATGGASQSLPLPAELRAALIELSPAAADDNGRLLFDVATSDNWYYRVAVADFGTKTVTVVPLSPGGEDLVPGWAPGGEIVAIHHNLTSALWRFRPR